MKNNTLEEIASRIIARDEWLIIGHIIPDGDCIGSMLSLYLALKRLDKKAVMLLDDYIQPVYAFLEGAEQFRTPKEMSGTYPSVICLDCSNIYRVEEPVRTYIAASQECINIDHHISNDYFGHFNFVDPEAAATGEIILDLLKHMGVKVEVSMAEALYAAIVMDTGGFFNANTTSETMRKAAILLDLGVDINKLRICMFESKSQMEMQLLGLALNSIAFTPDGKISWMVLNYEEVKSLGGKDFYPEGVIDYTRRVEGVELGILFRETEPGLIKIGFRSKDKIDVASLAEIFGGGGHRRAAGAKLPGTLAEVVNMVLNRVQDVV